MVLWYTCLSLCIVIPLRAVQRCSNARPPIRLMGPQFRHRCRSASAPQTPLTAYSMYMYTVPLGVKHPMDLSRKRHHAASTSSPLASDCRRSGDPVSTIEVYRHCGWECLGAVGMFRQLRRINRRDGYVFRMRETWLRGRRGELAA